MTGRPDGPLDDDREVSQSLVPAGFEAGATEPA
jgi:hypothetical protein